MIDLSFLRHLCSTRGGGKSLAPCPACFFFPAFQGGWGGGAWKTFSFPYTASTLAALVIGSPCSPEMCFNLFVCFFYMHCVMCFSGFPGSELFRSRRSLKGRSESCLLAHQKNKPCSSFQANDKMTFHATHPFLFLLF